MIRSRGCFHPQSCNGKRALSQQLTRWGSRIAVHSHLMKIRFSLAIALVFGIIPTGHGQQRTVNPELAAQRNELEKELESVAIIERKVMVPMRDGKRMAADIYRPKDESKKHPIIFSRTPYNFNFWD